MHGSYDFGDIGKMTGSNGDDWRQDFPELAEIAEGLADQPGG
ncbi:hypothetical protein [Pontixanthobacter gangjinensis]|nr:hypothetical protein [Pontixanthobacter gangjinensis]